MDPDYGKAPSEGGPVPSIGRPEELGVASPFDENAVALKDHLSRIGLSGDAPTLHAVKGEDPQALSDWLEKYPQGHCLVFWRSPVAAVARAMAEGVAPDEALNQWLGQAETLMGAVRRNRRRTTLVESSMAQAHPGMLAERLAQRLALSLSTSSNITGPSEDLDPIETLIAERTVVTNALAHRIAQELEATALPLGAGKDDLLPDPLTAWQSHRTHEKVVRADYERVRSENRELRQERQALKRQLDEQEASSGSNQARDQLELKEENDLLLQQLHNVQEELESYYLESREHQQKYQKAESERKKLERECNSALQRAGMLQNKIDAMRKSRSWRLTKPLRAGNLLKRKKAK